MTNKNGILILASGTLPQAAVSEVEKRRNGEEVCVLCFDHETQSFSLPQDWQYKRTSEFLDTDELRQQFLAFLDAWPKKEFSDGFCFDDMFRLDGGYSLWWTGGPGYERHPEERVFIQIRSLWIANSAIDELKPGKVLIFTASSTQAGLFASRCQQADCEYDFLPGSSKPEPLQGRFMWLVEALAWVFIRPYLMLLRSIFARLLGGRRRESPKELKKPAVLMTSHFPRHTHIGRRGRSIWYWRELAESLSITDSTVRQRHLLLTSPTPTDKHRLVLQIFHTGWPSLRGLEETGSLSEASTGFFAYQRAMPRQLSYIFKYFRLEHNPLFRDSLRFTGTDVSCLYIPLLRQAIINVARWSWSITAITKAVQSMGNVTVMIVHQELYTEGMMCIAAAKRLSIMTVGVQHGNIFPMHLIYTLPEGQVKSTPLPDYFAVYGDYNKEVIGKYGAFPTERIRITGGPRFDYLINNPPDAAVARSQLGLPPDKHIVFIATQKYHWFEEATRAVFQAASKRNDLFVCLKTHPIDADRLNKYRGIAKEVGAANVRFYNDNFPKLLAACDILVSFTSTSILEAIILGRKTICVNFSDEPDRFPFVADGGSLPGNSTEQISESLEKLLDPGFQEEFKKRRESFLERHVGPTVTGSAAHTLSSLIVDLVRDRMTSNPEAKR